MPVVPAVASVRQLVLLQEVALAEDLPAPAAREVLDVAHQVVGLGERLLTGRAAEECLLGMGVAVLHEGRRVRQPLAAERAAEETRPAELAVAVCIVAAQAGAVAAAGPAQAAAEGILLCVRALVLGQGGLVEKGLPALGAVIMPALLLVLVVHVFHQAPDLGEG